MDGRGRALVSRTKTRVVVLVRIPNYCIIVTQLYGITYTERDQHSVELFYYRNRRHRHHHYRYILMCSRRRASGTVSQSQWGGDLTPRQHAAGMQGESIAISFLLSGNSKDDAPRQPRNCFQYDALFIIECLTITYEMRIGRSLVQRSFVSKRKFTYFFF